MSYQIAIDGPAGAGKSTIAKAVAKKLGYIYVDTGAMYRAMALYLLRRGIGSGETEKISRASAHAEITIRYEDGVQQVILNGENVTGLLRTEEVGNMASASSVNRDVRLKLVELQRELAARENVVMDGRDIGTVVLPQADVKIFLTAAPESRARRRLLELEGRGQKTDFETVLRDIVQRDEQDRNRPIAPLRQAEDAVLLDTTRLNLEESLAAMLFLIKEKIHL